MNKNYNINGNETHLENEGFVFSKCRRSAHSLLFLIIATLCSILGVAEVNAQASITFPPSPNAGMNATTQTISLSQALTGFIIYTSQPGKATPSLSITSAKNLSGATISSSQYSISSATGVSGYTNKSPYIYQATFKATSAGVYTIYASAYFGTSATGTKTITVLNDTEISFTKGNQTLTVAEVRGKDLSVLAPATSNSTGQKSYSVRNSSNTSVKLTNNCLPEDLPAGTYTITVNVAATSTHINASKTCTLTVVKGESSTSATASKQLTLSAGTVSYDLSGLLSAGNYGSDNYTYTMDATDGASISGSTFTATKGGQYIVTITQTEDDAYFDSYTTAMIVVKKSESSTQIIGGDNLEFTLSSGIVSKDLNEYMSSENYGSGNYYYSFMRKYDGVTLSGSTITATKAGECIVRIYQLEDDAYLESFTTFNINVYKEASITEASDAELAMHLGQAVSKDISELLSGDNRGSGNYTYSMEDTDGASISGSTFTAANAGTYTVTITQTANDAYLESSVECTITVLRLMEGTVRTGESLDLGTLGISSSGLSYQLTGDNASDATINGTNFTSNVEGIYNVDVYRDEEKIDATRIHVSKHNHPYYEFDAHIDSYTGSYSLNHNLYTLYLPAWDFEAPVCGKNVRFCINDDDASTVTLVAGEPIVKENLSAAVRDDIPDEEHALYGKHVDSDENTGYYPVTDFMPAGQSTGLHANESLTNPIPNAKNKITLYENVNSIYAYRIDAAELIVPETVEFGGNTYTVTKIGVGALANTREHFAARGQFVTKGTESIVLPETIVELDNSAFRNTNASTVNFDDLPNLKRIGKQTFLGASIIDLDLTKNLQLECLGYEAFRLNSNMISADISGLSNLTTLEEGVFYHCASMTTLDMHNCSQITTVPRYYCAENTSLRLPNMDNTPIKTFGQSCFENCNFVGQTFDLRRLTSSWCSLNGFNNTGLKNIISDGSLIYFSELTSTTKPMIENIFVLKGKSYIYDRLGQDAFNGEEIVNKTVRVFERYESLVGNKLIDHECKDEKGYGDEYGPRVFPMLSANTSGVRTMSYFRPLDYSNIKVFDNTHLYDANKPDGTDYELEDFFRTDMAGIETLTPYIATAYDVENKLVTMTPLASSAPGIPTNGGIYYKGAGTSTDAAGNEILYILTEPNYSSSGDSRTYTNMYSGINYLKGGGKDAVDLSGAPHMTETSTQFISKGGTFYYSMRGTLAAYKAYLDLPEFIKTAADTDYSSSAKVTSLSFVWEDEPMQESETITSVNAISENRNGDFYNLQGMKVKIPQRSGLYISNGRKVLVK